MPTRLFAFALVLLCACTTPERPSPPPVGSRLTLTLVVSSPRYLTPERERAIAPVSDTGVAVLTVERVIADSAFGSYTGPANHFWPFFRDIGSQFRLTAGRNSWDLTLGPEVADAGMELRGTSDGRVVRGRWITRVSMPDSGTFTLAGQLTKR